MESVSSTPFCIPEMVKTEYVLMSLKHLVHWIRCSCCFRELVHAIYIECYMLCVCYVFHMHSYDFNMFLHVLMQIEYTLYMFYWLCASYYLRELGCNYRKRCP